jgi:hypothetical protein
MSGAPPPSPYIANVAPGFKTGNLPPAGGQTVEVSGAAKPRPLDRFVGRRPGVKERSPRSRGTTHRIVVTGHAILQATATPFVALFFLFLLRYASH